MAGQGLPVTEEDMGGLVEEMVVEAVAEGVEGVMVVEEGAVGEVGVD